MKVVYLILIIIIHFSIQVKAQEILDLNAKMDKNIFLIGEPIDIGISIINSSSIVQKVKLYGSVSIRIFDENSRELPYVGIIGADRISPTDTIIGAHEESYKVVSLLESFGNGIPGMPFVHYLGIGNYIVRIKYKHSYQEEKIIELPINVINPEGDEKYVYDTFLALGKDWPGWKYTYEDYTNMWLSLQEKHPKSVYAPLILSLVRTMYNICLNDRANVDKTIKNIVENYSTSSIAEPLIKHILKGIKSESAKKEFLARIKEKSKNSVMEKAIQQYQLGK